MSYTKGPWEVSSKTLRTILGKDADGIRFSICYMQNTHRTEQKANVQLIASAPDMLRALEIISNFTKCQCAVTHGDNPNCPIVIAKAAIAKATKGE